VPELDAGATDEPLRPLTAAFATIHGHRPNTTEDRGIWLAAWINTLHVTLYIARQRTGVNLQRLNWNIPIKNLLIHPCLIGAG
jgi:hypothetical protein